MSDKVSIVGLGKAGLPLAVVVAEAGYDVVGVDVSQRVVDMINAGECPITGEPGLPEMIAEFAGKKLTATADPVQGSKDTSIHIMIVPLFIDDEYQPDFSIVDAAARDVGKGLSAGDLVVMETTMPVGTTSSRLRKILEEESGMTAGKGFHLAYSPERIMTGYSISRFKEFPKIVGGIDDAATDRAYEFYSSFCSNVTKVSNTETAELTKIAEGIYRDVNIAVANELLKVCEAYGVDFWEMRSAANHDYCNIHEAGCGVGGHCIPVYPQFIIQDFKKKGLEAPLTELARNLNDGMAGYYKDKVLAALKEKGKDPAGSKVAVIGLTFREGVDETFYTRSKALVNHLKEAGADVIGCDPLMSKEKIMKEFEIEVHEGNDFTGFDAVILVNREARYKEALSQLADIPVIDCKNVLGK
ncbi:nucleotide sugar dehydrogenase [Candidatus Altiarchaeota archaeon]